MSADVVSVRPAIDAERGPIGQQGRRGFSCGGLVAEYAGHLVAKLPRAGGRALTDPWLPASNAVALLERAATLHPPPRSTP
jgi:hypothetical protein